VESLATEADLVARLGRDLTDDERVRVCALLADASALIRGYTGRDFTQAVDDTVVLRATGGTLRLPQRPVIEVKRVEAIGVSGAPDITLADWLFDGIDQIRLGEGNWIINLPEIWWDDDGFPGTYRVTYTHGYTQVPPDVVAVACQMTLRTLTSPAMVGGVTSETVGPYSYRSETPGQGAGGDVDGCRARVLDRYRTTTGTITVRI